jgi:thiol-disulfide isomerase/thioredoxin
MTILKFYGDYCSPCRTLTTMLDGANFPIKSINIQLEPEQTLKYNIRKVPTLVFVNENGDELHRETGLVAPEKVKEIMDSLK